MVCATLLTAGYWAENRGSGSASALPMLAVVLGACVTIWLALNVPALADGLDSRPVQWLGSRSFSLYLVHEPIVVTLTFAFGGRPAPWELLLTALPASLLAAELFWRGVERPSVIGARRLGDLVFQASKAKTAEVR